MSNDRLYVGNLSWNSDEDALRAHFAPFGTVKDAKVVTDRDTGRSRGFGFVTMGSDEEAEAARESLDGSTLDGRQLRVSVAEERRPRGGGGGGGRGGGGRDRGQRW